MPLLPYPQYLDHLRAESARFRDVLAGCDPDAKVPTCPEWDAADLLWHLAAVQLFWAKVIQYRPASPDDPAIGGEDAAQRPGTYLELVTAFEVHSEALVTELGRADPEEEAWHWSDDRRVGTSFRRQAHEALIHRVDAELTAGLRVTPLDPALADDGVAEVLGVMYGGAPDWGRFADSGETVRVRLTDSGTDLLLALGTFSGTDPESGATYHDEEAIALVDDGPEPATTISGAAGDLDLWLWKRDLDLVPGTRPDDRVRFEGDRAVFEKLMAVLGQPIT